MKNGDDRIDIFWLKKRWQWQQLYKVYKDRSWMPEGFTARLGFRKKVLGNAKAVGYLVHQDALNYDQVSAYSLNALTHREMLQHDTRINPRKYPPGKGERFLSQPSLRGTTVFLVAADVILTVAHSFRKKLYFKDYMGEENLDIEGMKEHVRVIFGYQISKRKRSWVSFDVRQVSRIGKILASCKNKNQDWALIKLSKPVNPKIFTPISLPNPSFSLKVGDPLYVLGHPRGMPMKFCPNGQVISKINKYKFRTSLDCFKGNSGSPIFHSQTHELVGMLKAGSQDFEIDEKLQCIKTQYFSPTQIGPNGISGEIIQSLESFKSAIIENLPLPIIPKQTH